MKEFLDISVLMDSMLNNTEFEGVHVKGVRFLKDKIYLFTKTENYRLAGEAIPINYQLDIPFSNLKAEIQNRLCLKVFETSPMNIVENRKAIRVLFIFEDHVLYNDTELKVENKDLNEFLEIHVKELYKKDSIEGQKILKENPITNLYHKSYDGRYEIIEYALCDKESSNIISLLLNGYYRGITTEKTYIQGYDQKYLESKLNIQPLTVIPCQREVQYLSLTENLNFCYQTLKAKKVSSHATTKIVIANTSKRIPILAKTKIDKIKNGIFIFRDSLVTEILAYLYGSNLKAGNKSIGRLNCLALTKQVCTKVGNFYRIDTIQGKATDKLSDQEVNFKEIISDDLDNISSIYDVLIVDKYNEYLHTEDIIKLSQSMIVIINENYNNLHDLAGFIKSKMQDNAQVFIERLKLVGCVGREEILFITDSFRKLLSTNSPILKSISLKDTIGQCKASDNQVMPLTIEFLLSTLTQTYDCITVKEDGIYIQKDKNIIKYSKKGTINYSITKGDLLYYILNLPDIDFINTMQEEQLDNLSCIHTFAFDKTKVRITCFFTDGEYKLVVKKLHQKLVGNQEQVQKVFTEANQGKLPTGLWLINTSPDGGKKTLLRSLLPIISKVIDNHKILVFNPEKDLILEDFEVQDSNTDITFSRKYCNQYLVNDLQPRVIIITRLNINDDIAKLLKSLSSKQLVIILTNHRTLSTALKLNFNDEDIKETFGRYFSCSISQQLVKCNNGEIVPIREIITRKDIDAIMKDSEGSPNTYKSKLLAGLANKDTTFINYESELQRLVTAGKLSDTDKDQYLR